MINRQHLNTLLKINGLATTAPDTDIRSTLLAANYNDTEIESALLLLKQNIGGNQPRTDGLYKVFYSDTHLKSAEISNLLGIDVSIDETIQYQHDRRRVMSSFQFILVWFFSVVVAVSGILFYMYLNGTGLFHPSVALAGL